MRDDFSILGRSAQYEDVSLDVNRQPRRVILHPRSLTLRTLRHLRKVAESGGIGGETLMNPMDNTHETGHDQDTPKVRKGVDLRKVPNLDLKDWLRR